VINGSTSAGEALDIGRDGEKSETITSSPPPKEGCDRTVILRLQPLESKHSFSCDVIEAQDVFSSSQMSWAGGRTVKTTVPAHSRATIAKAVIKIPAEKVGTPTGIYEAHREFSPPPNEGLWPNGDNWL
jgi:hypothetical protein